MPMDQQITPAGDPETYRIRVYGHVDPRSAGFWHGMSITSEEDAEGRTISTLTGRLADQAVLAGVLNSLYDLGYALLSVECPIQQE